MGQASDFAKIYERYYQSSFIFVKSYVRDIMVAEDIVSESLIHLWKVMLKEPVEYPYTLLVTILRHETLNHLKRESIRKAAMESISRAMIRDLDYRIISLEACNPEEIFSSEVMAIVEKTLQSLPLQTRRVFEMSRFENRTVKDIAVELSISPKAVEYHITKSLKQLRITLKEYLPLFLFFIN